MRENKYQSDLIIRLRHLFPGSVILKNDSAYLQGIPDLTILFEDKWAMLEVKAHAHAPEQPNQDFYIHYLNGKSFAAFIYPENEEEVICALQQAFGLGRPTRLSKRQQVPLDQLRR